MVVFDYENLKYRLIGRLELIVELAYRADCSA